MKSFLNRLILLIFMFVVTGGFYMLFCLIKSRPIIGHDFYIAIIAGVVLWIAYVLSGRMKDWPFK
jgi:hypothetical protein